MKRIFTSHPMLMWCFMMAAVLPQASAQTGFGDQFNDGFLSCKWAPGGGYQLSEVNNELHIAASNAGGSSFGNFGLSLPGINVAANPVVRVRVKSSQPFTLRIDLSDTDGKGTNANPVQFSIPGNNTYAEYTFNFSGRFQQSFPNSSPVNPNAIGYMVVFFNPGGSAFTGSVFFDDLQIGTGGVTDGNPQGCAGYNIPDPNRAYRINQVGFYPAAEKLAVYAGTAGPSFQVKAVSNDAILFSGQLQTSRYYPHSNEQVRLADFSALTSPGWYYLQVTGDTGKSAPFQIHPRVYASLAPAAVKAFYFNRSSMALTPQFAGPWARAMGHPDNIVQIHASAAGPNRPAGSIISSVGGWYDAGDYNSYVVNSGITMHNLLLAYEQFKPYLDTLPLNIPESGNTLPDFLDEVKYNLDWMLTMQDPNDGGVYHKKTSANFSGAVMPAADVATRFVVSKGTAASFDFAAVMAMAYRVFLPHLPAYAQQCLAAARRAYQWGVLNPNLPFTNPPGISTGEYGDSQLGDEYEWAATELYISTGEDAYYAQSFKPGNWYDLPAWPGVRSLGLVSLWQHRASLTALGKADTLAIRQKIIDLANIGAVHKATNAYGTVMGSRGAADFPWGSNSVALNHALLNLQAFLATGQQGYYTTAGSALDYVLGRNATGYCMVTGFGTRRVMNPHHRQSYADAVADPVPGWVAGGPTISAQQDCGSSLYPSTTFPAISYIDSWCSYSTNEVAINWNGPLAYVAIGMEFLAARAQQPSSYRFTGSGNWTDASQWEQGMRPPNEVPAGITVTVAPSANGFLTIDVPVRISSGASLNLTPGARLLLPGKLVME